MGWIALVLISNIISAANNVFDKRLMNDRRLPPIVCTASFGVVGAPVVLIGFLAAPLAVGPEALPGLVAGALFIGAVWLYYDAVAREDISRLVPLMRLTTIQTLLLSALFLHERLRGAQWIAFGILLLSSVLLGLNPRRGGAPMVRTLLRIVPMTTLLALNNVLMAQALRTGSLWSVVVWENLGMVSAVVVLGGIWMCAGRAARPTIERRTAGALIMQQLIRLLIGLAPSAALAHGAPVAVLSALSGMQPVWVWILAIMFLGERMQRRDLLLKGGGLLGLIIALACLK